MTGTMGKAGDASGSRTGALPGLLAFSEKVWRGAGALAALTGGLVLVGWALDVEVLKRILPGLVAMNPVTALAFVLAGASLLLVGEGRGIVAGRALALVVALVGLLKLVEVFSG